jgi:hypothetical protein
VRQERKKEGKTELRKKEAGNRINKENRRK